jgi:hypothetical protein
LELAKKTVQARMASFNNKLASQGFQVVHGAVVGGNGLGLKALLQAGGQWLEAHVHGVNGLNIFPVPDGDTGTNMTLTMRSALAEAYSISEDNAGIVAAAIAHGALMGARGNSGVILSFSGPGNFYDARFSSCGSAGSGDSLSGRRHPRRRYNTDRGPLCG